MKVTYQELCVNGKTIRGLLSTPDNGEYKNLMPMFHGFTGHKNEHAYLFKQLTEQLVGLGYATIRFDFSGNGDSDGHFEEMTFHTLMDEADAIMEYAYKISGKKLIPLGFSMGGCINSLISYKHKENVERIVLISPAGNMDQNAKNRLRLLKTPEDRLIDLGGFYLSREFIESFQQDLLSHCPDFDKPVLIIHGSVDQAVSVEVGKKYNELYPNSKLCIVEDAPHGYNTVEFRNEIRKIIEENFK